MTKSLFFFFLCISLCYGIEIPSEFSFVRDFQSYPKIENPDDYLDYLKDKKRVEEYLALLDVKVRKLSPLRKWYEAQFFWSRIDNLKSFLKEDRCKQKYFKGYDRSGERPFWAGLSAKAFLWRKTLSIDTKNVALAHAHLISPINETKLALKIIKKDARRPRASEKFDERDVGIYRLPDELMEVGSWVDAIYSFSGRKIVVNPRNNPLLTLERATGNVFYPDSRLLLRAYREKVPLRKGNMVEQILSWLLTRLQSNLDKTRSRIEMINLVSDFYYDFVTLHPFFNGNGRIGRLLVDYFLSRYHLPTPIYPHFGDDVFLKKEDLREIFHDGVKISMLFHQELTFLLKNNIPLWFAQSHYFTPAEKRGLEGIPLIAKPYQLIPMMVSSYKGLVLDNSNKLALWAYAMNDRETLQNKTMNYFHGICRKNPFPEDFVRQVGGYPSLIPKEVPRRPTKVPIAEEITGLLDVRDWGSRSCQIDGGVNYVRRINEPYKERLLNEKALLFMATASYEEGLYTQDVLDMVSFLETCLQRRGINKDFVVELSKQEIFVPIVHLLQKRGRLTGKTMENLILLVATGMQKKALEGYSKTQGFELKSDLYNLQTFYQVYLKVLGKEKKSEEKLLAIFDAAVVYGYTLTYGPIYFGTYDPNNKKTERLSLQLLSLLSYLPKVSPKRNREVYMGLSENVFQGMRYGSLCMDQFLSSSKSLEVAKGFVKNGGFIHVLPITSYSSGRSIKDYSKFYFEDEVLLPIGITFKLLETRKNALGPNLSLVIMEEEPIDPYERQGRCLKK